MFEGLHHHQAVLFASTSQLLEKKRFLDVMLVCRDEAIMVHKLVLVAYSKYFDAVLLSHADRCPVINIDGLGIEFETLLAVIGFMYKGTADMTRCSVEAFHAALQALQIDMNIELVSTANGFSDQQPSTTTETELSNEMLTGNDLDIEQHEFVSSDIILPVDHISSSDVLPATEDKQDHRLIMQLHSEDLISDREEDEATCSSSVDYITKATLSSYDEAKPVEYILPVNQPFSKKSLSDQCLEGQKDVILSTLTEYSTAEEEQREPAWEPSDSVTVDVIYSKVEAGSEELIITDVDHPKAVQIGEPPTGDKVSCPDYQAVSLLLNFKEQDRNLSLSQEGEDSLATALPKVQVPILRPYEVQESQGIAVDDQLSVLSRSKEDSEVLLSQSKFGLLKDPAVYSKKEQDESIVEYTCILEPISGPEVEISSLAGMYDSSVSVIDQVKLVYPDTGQCLASVTSDDSEPCHKNDGDDQFEMDCVSHKTEASKDAEIEMDGSGNSAVCGSSGKPSDPEMPVVSAVMKAELSSKQQRLMISENTCHKYPSSRKKKHAGTIKPPKFVQPNCRQSEEDGTESLDTDSQKHDIDFSCSNDHNFDSLSQPSLHSRDKKDMWFFTDGWFRCKICHWRKRKSTTLLRHLMHHTGEKAFSCKYCNKSFSTQHRLEEHIRIHTGEMPYRCTLCNKAFASRRSLNVHINNHTRTKTYTCQDCGKVTSDRCNLRKHIRSVHKKFKHISCSVPDCKFKASDYRTVLVHIDKDHNEELPLDAQMYHMWHIQVREQFHNKEDLSCYKCSFKAKNFKSLYSHMRNMHQFRNERDASRNGCVATTESNVSAHIQCQYCTYLCLTSEKMKSHLEDVHEDLAGLNQANHWNSASLEGMSSVGLSVSGQLMQPRCSYNDLVNSQIEKILQTYRPLAPNLKSNSVGQPVYKEGKRLDVCTADQANKQTDGSMNVMAKTQHQPEGIDSFANSSNDDQQKGSAINPSQVPVSSVDRNISRSNTCIKLIPSVNTATVCSQNKKDEKVIAKKVLSCTSYCMKESEESGSQQNTKEPKVQIKIMPSHRTLSASQSYKLSAIRQTEVCPVPATITNSLPRADASRDTRNRKLTECSNHSLGSTDNKQKLTVILEGGDGMRNDKGQDNLAGSVSGKRLSSKNMRAVTSHSLNELVTEPSVWNAVDKEAQCIAIKIGRNPKKWDVGQKRQMNSLPSASCSVKVCSSQTSFESHDGLRTAQPKERKLDEIIKQDSSLTAVSQCTMTFIQSTAISSDFSDTDSTNALKVDYTCNEQKVRDISNSTSSISNQNKTKTFTEEDNVIEKLHKTTCQSGNHLTSISATPCIVTTTKAVSERMWQPLHLTVDQTVEDQTEERCNLGRLKASCLDRQEANVLSLCCSKEEAASALKENTRATGPTGIACTRIRQRHATKRRLLTSAKAKFSELPKTAGVNARSSEFGQMAHNGPASDCSSAKSGSYQCITCGFTGTTRSDLAAHSQLVHLSCKVCLTRI